MTSKSTIHFVTADEAQHQETRDALLSIGVDVQRMTLELPPIQSLDPVEVAAERVVTAYEHLKSPSSPVLVAEYGLAIRAWNGYPGALMNWVLDAVGETGLCRQLDPWDDRGARAVVVFCLYDGQQTHLFTGQADGYIAQNPRGTSNTGWDSIFQPAGYPITLGEMRREDKMKISMRAQAINSLRSYLITWAELNNG